MKTALLGLHDCEILDDMKNMLQYEDYDVTGISTLKEMKDLSSRHYDIFVMDINLDHPGEHNTTPLQEMYALVGSKVASGRSKLIAVSGLRSIVEQAKQLHLDGVVVLSKIDLVQYRWD